MVKSKARDFTENTIKRLYALAHNRCSFPDCEKLIAPDETGDLLVNICHIEGANPGSARYNKNSNDGERRSYENLILRCPNHHTETNDEKKYAVNVLKQMKKEHHAAMRERVSTSGLMVKYPTALGEIINQLSVLDLDDPLNQSAPAQSFKIEEKISYNNVIRHRSIIKEYMIYQGKLNTIYVEIEMRASYKKEQLLQKVRSLYLKAKGKLLGGDERVENIRYNADNLIDEVEIGLWNLIEKRANNLRPELPYEVIDTGLMIVLVDAFLRCKILEEPVKQ